MNDRDPFVGDPWETDDHNDGEDHDSYAQILADRMAAMRECDRRLEVLRENCPHDQGLTDWLPGYMQGAKLCRLCFKPIEIDPKRGVVVRGVRGARF